MLIDIIIVGVYFVAIMWLALKGRVGKQISTEEYFLSSRNLRWPSIAISTIATNIQGYQFLGMVGSAYLYGLAQANLEINAMQGILLAAFVFVPLYLRDKVVTITQFIQSRLGQRTGFVYSLANLAILSTLGLGAALFWGAYAADIVFESYLSWFHPSRVVRVISLAVTLGVFSAVYTYLGGLGAVVKTDILQFVMLTTGGIIILVLAVYHAGGWSNLMEKQSDMMHLHLPADHPTLPWIAIPGMLLLNINYWCANQSVIQRSLAARNLREAQIGLMVGGVMKYGMAIIIIIPGIALAAILFDNPLSDPDQAFPYMISHFLPQGLRGLIVCALFASLMSTVDSLYNSLSTLWAVDIYKGWINKSASDQQVVAAGRRSILVFLLTGIGMASILTYVKFENPELAFTHTLNDLRYFVNCGIVVLICGAAFLVVKREMWSILAFFLTIVLHLSIQVFSPDLNYFVRAMWVILLAFMVLVVLSKGFRKSGLSQDFGKDAVYAGWGLLLSLIMLHIIFH
ncbi:MAG: sodium/solute symporter [Bacteroidota bacterium]